jgi:hypothetical protein
MLNRQAALAEGLADHENDLAIEEALAAFIDWQCQVWDPCCADCGWLDWAKQERKAALRQYRKLTQAESECVVSFEPVVFDDDRDMLVAAWSENAPPVQWMF